MPSSSSTVDQISADKLTELRRWIRTATNDGYKPAEIEPVLREKYGVGVSDVMKFNQADYGRSLAQGLTLDHADELRGFWAKLTGGDYAQARDQVRANDAESRAANPGANAAVRGVASFIPGLAASAIPGMQPTAGMTGLNALRGVAMGMGMGGLQGEGQSTAPTAGGVAKDAGVGAAIGGVTGGVLGAVGSKLADRLRPDRVDQAAAAVLPTDPAVAHAMLQRQESLVPGSVVLADVDPAMRTLTRLIGADAKTVVVAKQEAADRVKAIVSTLREVGKHYESLKGQKVPVDNELGIVLKAAKDAGGSRVPLLRGQKEIDLGVLQNLRSTLKKGARSRSDVLAGEKGKVADLLSAWMTKDDKAPGLRQVDSDYAFLTERAKAAKETLKAVTNSAAAYSRNKLAGVDAASPGGTIPMSRQGMVGTAFHAITKPNPAKTAREVAKLLLTPQRDATSFERLLGVRGMITSDHPMVGATIGQAVTSGVLPAQVTSLFQSPETQ